MVKTGFKIAVKLLLLLIDWFKLILLSIHWCRDTHKEKTVYTFLGLTFISPSLWHVYCFITNAFACSFVSKKYFKYWVFSNVEDSTKWRCNIKEKDNLVCTYFKVHKWPDMYNLGWMDAKAVLRFAFSNQKTFPNSTLTFIIISTEN